MQGGAPEGQMTLFNSAVEVILDSTSTKLYKNDGSGNFTLESGTPFNGVSNGVVGIADLDGNGHNDIIIAGDDTSNFDHFDLFWNDGASNFTTGPILVTNKIENGDIKFGDIDGDTDVDFILGGGVTENITIFRNNVYNGNAVFADANGDAKVDLVLNGLNSGFQVTTKLYGNDFPGFGCVIDFDGVNTYTIPHLAAVNTLPITFEFWAQATDFTTGFYRKTDSGGGAILIRVLAGYHRLTFPVSPIYLLKMVYLRIKLLLGFAVSGLEDGIGFLVFLVVDF